MKKKSDVTQKRCAWVTDNPLYIHYHDFEWGVPVYDDRLLFEFLILEGMQAGLNWLTILKKRNNFRDSFDNFEAKVISKYNQRKIDRLLANTGIIRNQLKINAAIDNAKAFLKIQQEWGMFSSYIWHFVNHPIQNRWKNAKEVPSTSSISDAMSKDLKKRGFKFVGSTICYAFMQAIGMVNDHTMNCFRYKEINKSANITTDQLKQAIEEIFSALKHQENKLEAIKASGESLINKWQTFLGIILPAQIKVAKKLGFSSDQSGVSAFNRVLMERQTDKKLNQLNREKWNYYLEKAFDIHETKQLTLKKAKDLITDITAAMTTNDFLKRIDKMIERIGKNASILKKRKALLNILLPLHLSVMEKHGFYGEQGYVQAQKALMDYYHDPFIMEQANHAQTIVFKRAKLL